MMSLGDDKIRSVAFFCEIDSNCFSSIDDIEEQRRTQNKENEVIYARSEISFLTGYLPIERKLIAFSKYFYQTKVYKY